MKRDRWIILYLAILAVHLAGIFLNDELIQVLTKPLLVILLVLYFLLRTKVWKGQLKNWVLAALFFSWAGDILLMFQEKSELFFLSGLAVFLAAQLFYIVFFHNIRIRERIKGYWIFLPVVMIYYIALITFLSPFPRKMGLPVRVYGIVISIMFLLALHMLFIKNKIAGRLMMAGALLFIISDSVLAINRFYNQFEPAGLIVMLTYGLAQLLITDGAINYIRKE
ncbi:MAG: hypothetical protein B6D37_02680 [Sphingobacteriales bacterium UTBCD1]|jgi:uncharacterized membrane protein YhhN|nr:MAG: hypothetical protein B6D37_02680 [Sphingobacteriales bacterium UTBCD1]